MPTDSHFDGMDSHAPAAGGPPPNEVYAERILAFTSNAYDNGIIFHGQFSHSFDPPPEFLIPNNTPARDW